MIEPLTYGRSNPTKQFKGNCAYGPYNQPLCKLLGFLRDVREVPKKKSDTVLFEQANQSC